MRFPSTPFKEFHLSVLGQHGVGKSAFILKYLTRRFIGEYDSSLEETYCREDTIDGDNVMVWIMDRIDGEGESNGWQSWSDLFIIMYDITCSKSLSYAERLLERLNRHEHSLCSRDHKTILLANKTDLERYRVVSEDEGRRVAASYRVQFYEINLTGDVMGLNEVIHNGISLVIGKSTVSPTRLCSSDSEITTSQSRKSAFSVSIRSSSSRLKESSKLAYLQKSPSLSKMNKTGSKLLKLFHN